MKKFLITLLLFCISCSTTAAPPTIQETKEPFVMWVLMSDSTLVEIEGVITAYASSSNPMRNPKYYELLKEISALEFLRENFPEEAERANQEIEKCKNLLQQTSSILYAFYLTLEDIRHKDSVEAVIISRGGIVIPGAAVTLH